MLEVLKRIGVRWGGLSLIVAVFAGLVAVIPSETVVRWIGLIGFAVAIVVTARWASRDMQDHDINTNLRDWLVVSFVLAVGWWIVLILLEGEKDIIQRLSTDFWSVMVTVGLVFAAAIVGSLATQRD